jgi:hypothetical protein
MVKELVLAMRPVALVETGSHRGTTTAFLCGLGLPVHTVEVKAQLYFYVHHRFRRDARVEVAHGDSREYLRKLATRSDFPKVRVLFYLDAHFDAHWGEDLPLREELRIIRRNWGESIVIIDDFEVPDDSGYGFDDYGPGRALSLSCQPIEELEYRIFWPRARAAEETGERRGCIVLATPDDAAHALRTVTRLRPHTSH